MISQITVDGNLARDPQEIQFKTGSSALTASIGHSQGYYSQQQHKWVDQGVLWIEIQAPANDPTLASARKGDHVVVSGVLSQHSFEGKDGQQHLVLRVRARQVSFVPRSQGQGQARGQDRVQGGQSRQPSRLAGPAPVQSGGPRPSAANAQAFQGGYQGGSAF